MKKKFQIIIINENSNYNKTFIINKLFLFLLSGIIIVSIIFTLWGIYAIINPSINQKIINNNMSLKYHTINLLNHLISHQTLEREIILIKKK